MEGKGNGSTFAGLEWACRCWVDFGAGRGRVNGAVNLERVMRACQPWQRFSPGDSRELALLLEGIDLESVKRWPRYERPTTASEKTPASSL